MRKRKRDRVRELAEKIDEQIAFEKLILLVIVGGICLYVAVTGDRSIVQ